MFLIAMFSCLHQQGHISVKNNVFPESILILISSERLCDLLHIFHALFCSCIEKFNEYTNFHMGEMWPLCLVFK